MKKTVVRYGLYSLLMMTGTLVITYLAFHKQRNWELEEVLGYTSILLASLFIYFGIRHWRDQYNQGRLSFGKGVGLGTLITLFPSIGFGLFSWLEMSVLNPEMCNQYYQHYVEKVKRSTPPAELQLALQKLEAEKEMFASPVAQFVVMFLTVFVIGIIVTVISTLILRRSKAKA